MEDVLKRKLYIYVAALRVNGKKEMLREIFYVCRM